MKQNIEAKKRQCRVCLLLIGHYKYNEKKAFETNLHGIFNSYALIIIVELRSAGSDESKRKYQSNCFWKKVYQQELPSKDSSSKSKAIINKKNYL